MVVQVIQLDGIVREAHPGLLQLPDPHIDAVQSRVPGFSPPSDDLMWACRGLPGMGFDAPHHLYSHRVGTGLDALLDNANEVAKHQA